MTQYNHKKIEKKWQEKWAADRLYQASEDSQTNKEYLLVEFPYPSGDGLHVGHVRSYTAMDIIARKHRMEGKNVLYPMGWDAFGLPTENFAVKTGIHPKKVTKQNTDKFRAQLQALGLSFDWEREINTTDPNYYKWTQWIFTQLFNKGLAYKKNMAINWCLDCKIGLANEEVVDGQCERCGGNTEKRDKEQWMLEITKYADRLVDDLDEVDYWDRIKTQQKNWIGRSEGAELKFEIRSTKSETNSNIQVQDTGNPSTTAGTGHGKKQTNSNSQSQNTKLKIVLLHGYSGTPEDNHQPWLRKELEKRGYEVVAPTLPNTNNPTEEEWVKTALGATHYDENTIIFGHSLGAVTALKVAEKLERNIAGIVLAGGFIDPEFKDHKRPFETTFTWEFDVEKIKDTAGFIHILHDKNDDAVSADQATRLGELFHLPVNTVEAKEEHFCGTEEPELLDEILRSSASSPRVSAPTSVGVFTTRPDTLFGATYLVLSPEHEEIANLKSKIQNWSAVEKYISAAKKKTEIERTAEEKEKTGVKLEGVSAINPANNAEIPVYIADYVLSHYGTGAIMAVPAHDERDYAFAQKYDIPVRHVVMPSVVDTVNAPRDDKPTKERYNVHAIVYDPKRNAYLALHSKEHDWKTVVIGGIEHGEDAVEAAKREVREETGYTNVTFECALGGPVQAGYFAKHKDENRKSITQALYFTLENEEQVEREDDDGEVIWVKPDDFKQGYMINSELPYWLERLPHTGVCVYTDSGVLVNSGEFDGMDSEKAKHAITEAVGGEMKTTYKLRDWVFSRQRYWGEPIPLVFCEHCAARINAEKNTEERGKLAGAFNEGEVRNPGWIVDENLPVELPEVADFMPTEDGDSPLAKAADWVETTCPKCGGEATRETDVMPNWAGSSWYYIAYCISENLSGADTTPEHFSSKKIQNQIRHWLPVDWYNGGMEHTTLHLLYSRFWHKFLYDQGLVPTKEPYTKRTSHGMILAEGGVKMSKSKGNTIDPQEVVDNIGADALRMYEMFMGPFDQAIAWNTDSMVGVRKFLDRIWGLQTRVNTDTAGDYAGDTEVELELHKTIKKVSEDIEQLKFNTAVAQMMILVNKMEKLDQIPITHYQLLIVILAPFAPHIAEELWQNGLEKSHSVHTEPWPTYDPEKIQGTHTTIAVQINGKVRDSFSVAIDATEEEIKQQAEERDSIQKWIAGASIKRIVYVPGKLVNIVVDGL